MCADFKIILLVFGARNNLIYTSLRDRGDFIIIISRNRRFYTQYIITARTIILDRFCYQRFLELFRFVFDRPGDKSLGRSSYTYGRAITINCRCRYAVRLVFFYTPGVYSRSTFVLKKKKKTRPFVPGNFDGNQLFYCPRETIPPRTVFLRRVFVPRPEFPPLNWE